MSDRTRGGRWGIQQRMPSDGAWTSAMVGVGYERLEDAEADVAVARPRPSPRRADE